MTTSLAPLRDEHRALAPHVDQLRTTADRVGVMPRVRLVSDVRSSLDFLTRHLRPHADIEDAVLYPQMTRITASTVATDVLRLEHSAISRFTDELQRVLEEIVTRGEVTRTEQNDVRRLLYGLHALICTHIAAEDEIVLPTLESRLADADAAHLFDAVQAIHTRHAGTAGTAGTARPRVRAT